MPNSRARETPTAFPLALKCRWATAPILDRQHRIHHDAGAGTACDALLAGAVGTLVDVPPLFRHSAQENLQRSLESPPHHFPSM